MSYYGEARDYYGERPPAAYDRPPYDRPSYDRPPPPPERPPYERPPYEERRSYDSRPPYDRPPYEGQRSYDSRPPYSSAPPSTRPPSYPPPPLPIGWIQEWEPSARRAFYVETATGRTEWTLPADVSYSEGSRSGPGGYYASPPPPAPAPAPGYPPQEYAAPAYPPQGYGDEYQQEEKKTHSDTGKILAAGAAGLAIGAVGGAILEHELTMRNTTLTIPMRSRTTRTTAMTEGAGTGKKICGFRGHGV
ncbi:hypothetical protein BDW66DRAFT_46108 [Aspergillus desertorum]